MVAGLTPVVAGLAGGTLDDRRVALGTGKVVPKVPAGLGNADLTTDEDGCAGDDSVVAVKRFCWIRCVVGGSCGGPGGTGTVGTAKDSFRIGFPRVEKGCISVSARFFVIVTGSISLCFFGEDFCATD